MLKNNKKTENRQKVAQVLHFVNFAIIFCAFCVKMPEFITRKGDKNVFKRK